PPRRDLPAGRRVLLATHGESMQVATMSANDSPGSPNSETPPPLGAVPQHAPPPAKRSALPWVLGGCGCLLLLSAIIAIAAVVFFGVSVKKEMEKIVPYDASTTTDTDDDPLPSSGSGGS